MKRSATFRRSALFIALVTAVTCPPQIFASDSGGAPINTPRKATPETQANQAPPMGNPAFDFMTSLIGGEWRIDTRLDNGQRFRERSVYTWGPERRFIIATNFFVMGDDGTETWGSVNVFAVAGDHIVNYAFLSDGSVDTAPMILSDGTMDSIWTSKGTATHQRVKVIGPGKMAWEYLTQKSDGQWQGVKGTWFRK